MVHAYGVRLWNYKSEKFTLSMKTGVRTYYETFHPDRPNFVTLLGPMNGLGHNSIIFMIECWLQIIINAIRHLLSRKAECVPIKEEKLSEMMKEWTRRVDKSVWAPSTCNSWYQQGDPSARPWGLWPGTTTEYYWRTKNIPSENFTFYS